MLLRRALLAAVTRWSLCCCVLLHLLAPASSRGRQDFAERPPEPEAVRLRPAEEEFLVPGQAQQVEIAAYDVPQASDELCLWRLEIHVLDCSGSRSLLSLVECVPFWHNMNLTESGPSLCHCALEADEGPSDMGWNLTGPFLCRYATKPWAEGRYFVEVHLLDPSRNVRSYSAGTTVIRRPRHERNEKLPACLLTDLPMSAQDDACLWYWKRFDPGAIVYLSQQELSAQGSWGWLLTHFAGVPVNSSDFSRSLPLEGALAARGSCAVVGSAWHLGGSGVQKEPHISPKRALYQPQKETC